MKLIDLLVLIIEPMQFLIDRQSGSQLAFPSFNGLFEVNYDVSRLEIRRVFSRQSYPIIVFSEKWTSS